MHIENELERPVAAWEDEDDYNPSRGYNIAPRTRNPIILRGGASGDADHEPEDQHDTDSGHGKKTDSGKTVLRMENMQWGLIPHWMKRAPGRQFSIPAFIREWRSSCLRHFQTLEAC